MTAERRAQLVAELARRADVDEAFAAAALERITRSWTRDAALGVLELQGHELRVDDVPFDPAPPPVWAMLRRLGSTYEPATYQLKLGGDVVDEATP